MKKILWSFFTILLVGLLLFFYWRFYFVYAEGTKAGQLNTFQLKGIIFKTYEGKIIQSGFKANVESNYFDFSVSKESVAKTLLENSGKDIEVHYKRYFASLPWRGTESYIVDSIYSIQGGAFQPDIKGK
jgi:hypothetical protein